jgi:folate-binding protein YgfZ
MTNTRVTLPQTQSFLFHPNTPTSPWQTRWISLEGPDARDFLHRLTTARAQALNPGEGTPACFLNPQGKIRATFHLWCLEETLFALEVPAGKDLDFHRELLAAIDQYTFAEKMTLSDISTETLDCIWLFPHPAHAWLKPKAHSTWASEEEIRFNDHGAIDFGRPWLSVWGRPERLRQWADRNLNDFAPLTSQQLETLRIQACRPWVGFEITDQVTPLDIGLPDSVAENKGCYPGQEVIEKIAALGSPAKRLVQATLSQAGTLQGLGAGTKLYSSHSEPPLEVGQLTSSSETQFLAIVRKTHAKEGAELRVGPSGPLAKVSRVAPYLKEEAPPETEGP